MLFFIDILRSRKLHEFSSSSCCASSNLMGWRINEQEEFLKLQMCSCPENEYVIDCCLLKGVWNLLIFLHIYNKHLKKDLSALGVFVKFGWSLEDPIFEISLWYKISEPASPNFDMPPNPQFVSYIADSLQGSPSYMSCSGLDIKTVKFQHFVLPLSIGYYCPSTDNCMSAWLLISMQVLKM